MTVRGTGKGGRNQEFALAAGLDISGQEDILLLSAGTDGTDGPTDAAGAIADGSTVRRSAEALWKHSTTMIRTGFSRTWVILSSRGRPARM